MKIWEEKGYLYVNGTAKERKDILEVIREGEDNPELNWEKL